MNYQEHECGHEYEFEYEQASDWKLPIPHSLLINGSTISTIGGESSSDKEPEEIASILENIANFEAGDIPPSYRLHQAADSGIPINNEYYLPGNSGNIQAMLKAAKKYLLGGE